MNCTHNYIDGTQCTDYAVYCVKSTEGANVVELKLCHFHMQKSILTKCDSGLELNIKKIKH